MCEIILNLSTNFLNITLKSRSMFCSMLQSFSNWYGKPSADACTNVLSMVLSTILNKPCAFLTVEISWPLTSACGLNPSKTAWLESLRVQHHNRIQKEWQLQLFLRIQTQIWVSHLIINNPVVFANTPCICEWVCVWEQIRRVYIFEPLS